MQSQAIGTTETERPIKIKFSAIVEFETATQLKKNTKPNSNKIEKGTQI